MNWIEIIEIRTQQKSKEKLEVELQKLLTEINKEKKGFNVKIYNRMNLETDFIILIVNESEKVLVGNNQLGVRLNEALKEFGMVNYSKWLELKPQSVQQKN